ncbi:carboxymuconolactone decarboxylase family protein [Magnetofaba australis]|uniref:Putative Alkylhydroperoxidase AhpD n=1 Tax=Magnetofaba australis IT-1 TaxID=1434232 RepID=A0A1Y2K6K2_9PROT|nr:carboxymuconolactone decarboxylase family protein [Magnetofaba australis]OSM04978.1 putative Alkylhydroperoxidase AhpD [Magnetofaba australis IT-1]
MSHIPTPESIQQAPHGSQNLLQAVQQKLGVVPNLFRIVANSPAALQGYLGLLAALETGALEAATHERIALAVAQVNGCGYCLAAHCYLGSNIAHLSDEEMEANRKGFSSDAKAEAAVRFAADIAQSRGHVASSAVQNVKAAGYSDAEIVEIVVHVALNTLTNYVNSALGTAIDFPQVRELAA